MMKPENIKSVATKLINNYLIRVGPYFDRFLAGFVNYLNNY